MGKQRIKKDPKKTTSLCIPFPHPITNRPLLSTKRTNNSPNNSSINLYCTPRRIWNAPIHKRTGKRNHQSTKGQTHNQKGLGLYTNLDNSIALGIERNFVIENLINS